MKKDSVKPETIQEMKPRISFDEKQLPAIKGWKVGSEYTVELKLKQLSQRIEDEMMMNSEGKRGNPMFSASFEVVEAKTKKGGKILDKTRNSDKMTTLIEKAEKY